MATTTTSDPRSRIVLGEENRHHARDGIQSLAAQHCQKSGGDTVHTRKQRPKSFSRDSPPVTLTFLRMIAYTIERSLRRKPSQVAASA